MNQLILRTAISSLGGLFLIFAIACSGSAKITQGNDASASVYKPNNLTSASAEISASTGGYINVGKAQLRIPAQALEADTTITAEVADIALPEGGAKAIGKGIRLKPEGLQFLKPAELMLCYSPTEASNLNASGAKIYYHTEDNQYVAIAGNADLSTSCVTSHIEHFSSYVAAAYSQLPGNTAPVIGGANFLPTTPLAGIPLRVRTTIDDTNGSTPIGTTVPGTVVTAFFYYRTVGSPTFTKVALQPDTTDDTVTNRYFFQIPGSEVTTAGIEYYFEATDNLNVTRRVPTAAGSFSTRTVPTAATGIRLNPTGSVNISAGFSRAFTLQATDNGTTWQNISADNFSLTNSSLGTALRTGPSTIRFNAVGAGTGQLSSTIGALSTSTTLHVVPGLLTHIELTDTNQVALAGSLELPVSQVYNFDVVGYDSYGNVAQVYPAFTTTGGIGNVVVDVTGAHFTPAATVGSGSLLADLAGLTDTLSISLYVPPQVTATAPFDQTTGIALNASVGVSFSHVMDTSTLTTTTTSACVGSLQVSSDNFATCVAMASATPTFYASNTLAVIQPALNLAGTTTYKIRVTMAARNTGGYPIAQVYTTPTGFTTVMALPVPVIVSVNPPDSATSIAENTQIAITFSIAMNAATLTTSTSGVCSGSIRLSADSFSTCVPMTNSLAILSNGGTTATLVPAVTLQPGGRYKLQVTTDVLSTLNVPIAFEFLQPNGWTIARSSWYTYIGSSHIDQISKTIKTNDNGFVAIGSGFGRNSALQNRFPINPYSDPFSSQRDCLITKLTADGDVEWYTYLGSSGVYQNCIDGVTTQDGGSILLGVTYNDISSIEGKSPIQGYTSTYANQPNNFVVKLSSTGHVEWYTFLNVDGSQLTRIAQNADASFALIGTIYNNAATVHGLSPLNPHAGGGEMVLLRLSPSGSLQWFTYLGGPGDEVVLGIETGVDGLLHMIGRASQNISALSGISPSRPYSGAVDGVIYKVDPVTGNVVWYAFYGTSGNDSVWDFVLMPDGGFTLYGFANADIPSYNGLAPIRGFGGIFDTWVLRVDATGNPIWHTFLGSAVSGNRVATNAQGELFLFGSTPLVAGINPVRPYNVLGGATNGTQLFVTKLNASGAMQWWTYQGGDGYSEGIGSVVATNSGGVIISGSGYDFAFPSPALPSPIVPREGSEDWFVIKLKADGSY